MSFIKKSNQTLHEKKSCCTFKQTNGKLPSLCWSDRGITAGLFCHSLSLSAMPPSIFTGKIFTELQLALIVGWEVAAGKHLPFLYIALV